MTVFKTISPCNTEPAINMAIAKAKELMAGIVISTTSGASAAETMELAKKAGYTGRIVAVTHVWGMKTPGENELTAENRKKLEDGGVIIVSAAHALSGAERSLSGRFNGAYPVEIMAHTLRMFGQGVKVCVEIASMALDAGAIEYGSPLIALGGTGRGLDTACVITPAYTAKILETKVHEILCKPY